MEAAEVLGSRSSMSSRRPVSSSVVSSSVEALDYAHLTSLLVLDEVTNSLGAEANDRETACQALKHDLTKRFGPGRDLKVSYRLRCNEKTTHQLGKAKMSAEANAAASS